MATPLNPQEIYLLERYSSLLYFGEMRDHFAAMVQAANDALAKFMQNLPPDYRDRPLHEQPDAVWGERVLPNLQWTLKGLNDGYIDLSRGDWGALSMAGNVSTAFAGISRDYPWDWMPEPFQSLYDAQRRLCSKSSFNISLTSLAQWRSGAVAQWRSGAVAQWQPNRKVHRRQSRPAGATAVLAAIQAGAFGARHDG